MKIFNCCPACGSSDIVFDDDKKLICWQCAFTYYHNVAAAVAAILEYDNKIVLIKRAKEPGKGKLDLPGGFVDPKESAEQKRTRIGRPSIWYLNPSGGGTTSSLRLSCSRAKPKLEPAMLPSLQRRTMQRKQRRA